MESHGLLGVGTVHVGGAADATPRVVFHIGVSVIVYTENQYVSTNVQTIVEWLHRPEITTLSHALSKMSKMSIE